METKQIIEKTEALIDALRATCSAYGLSGDSSEYKIIAAHGVSVRSLDQGGRSLICSPKMRIEKRKSVRASVSL